LERFDAAVMGCRSCGLSLSKGYTSAFAVYACMTEPCPFCGARIMPLMIGDIKKCPVCGRMWSEGGGFGARPWYGGDGGPGAAAIA
jgi:ribosomal protein L37AE/L43A